MKRLILVILATFVIAASGEAKPHRGVGFNLFYSSLSPHGEWIEMSFGTVWRPYHVGNYWRPYLMGRWIWTDYGWYWSSYEPFGWATYHYGRWIYDDYYGWIWVPDDVWGPAWVEWRYDNDYIGWAPLPPYANFSINIGLTYGRDWYAPVHYWNFVPCANFSSVHINNYVQSPDVSRRIFGRTRSGGHVRVVDRRVVNDGLALDRVEGLTRERIRKVDVVDRQGPGEDRIVNRGNRERVEVYRPGPDELKRESVIRDRNAPARPDVNRDDGAARREREAGRAPGESRSRIYQREPNAAERRAMDKPAVREREAQRPQINRESQRAEPRSGQQLNRERTQQQPQRRQIDRSPQQQPQRQQIDRNRQNQGRQRPEVSRERPAVRRDKPDGGGSRSGQSGRRGRGG